MQQYADDIFVGYRWHDSRHIAPLFAFGFGLSYTTFDYGHARLSSVELTADGEIQITVPVTNSGKTAGKETVQLYIGEVAPALPRPPKELKDFRKIALKPNETREVTFTIKADALCHFDEHAHAWKATPGLYKAFIGPSSVEFPIELQFTLK